MTLLSLYYRRVLKAKPPMPKAFSTVVRDFITSLLTKDPKRRLGARGSHEVKNHKFFKVNDFTFSEQCWLFQAYLKQFLALLIS